MNFQGKLTFRDMGSGEWELHTGTKTYRVFPKTRVFMQLGDVEAFHGKAVIIEGEETTGDAMATGGSSMAGLNASSLTLQ